MASIFTRIVSGEIPAYKVAENEHYFAFLDINPVAKGHVLVITKQEIDYIFNVEDEQLGGLMIFAKRVAKALAEVVPSARIGVTVIGLEVPHTHVHLIPINSLHDMDFAKPRVQLSKEEFADLAKAISDRFV
ncbi:MAG: HIT family protein [Saprospiraceae bacterium]|nr:HIT family protein [Saprospiraceae bacterium]MBP7679685.1 HIT family protein [Saprospiraceae bacterium]